MYKNKSYNADDLNKVPEYKALVAGTTEILERAIKDNDLSDSMLKSLNEDVFLFSGLKTNAQLFEASRQLLTKDNTIKSFELFSKDIASMKSNYNDNYLEAEYQFAVSSVQMASRYENFSDSSRYLLQYRTANDERVRASHEALHDITLPKTDVFWDQFFPPNGWRCRCTTVEVLASTNEVSPSEKSYEAGEKATTQIGKNGGNKLGIFRFNAGKQKLAFPPNHPYNKVVGAKTVRKNQIVNARENEASKTSQKGPEFTPSNLADYEKELKVKVNTEIFSYLTKEVPLLHKKKGAKGAHYSPSDGHVYIPINQRRKNSKWCAESIYYHEYGHAIDWHINLRKGKEVQALMKKYKSEFGAVPKGEKQTTYRIIHEKIVLKYKEAREAKNNDSLEKIGATADTLMSLNTAYGYGHTKRYFKGAGKKEAEFIAHAFENKFIGNDIFKELMPELYKDMIEYIEGIEKPKLD